MTTSRPLPDLRFDPAGPGRDESAVPETGRRLSGLGGGKRFVARVAAALGDPFVVVLGVWLVGVLGLWNFVQTTSISLPFCDEYCFVGVATGQEKVTAAWLWTPANEHRAPLLRLYLVALGELTHWDFRVFLRVNLAVLGAGALALVLAARAVRGRSILADCFLPLLVLSPNGFDTIVLYSYAYTPVFGAMAVVLALVATGLVYRLWWASVGYAAAVPVFALAGGPAGQVWALAMLTAVPFLWARADLGRFRYAVLAALVVGGAVAVAMIRATPEPAGPGLDALKAKTTWDAVRFAAMNAVGWLGLFPLQVLWPYPVAVLAVPLAYVAGRGAGRLVTAARRRSLSAGDLPTWVPVAAVLVACLAITAVIGYTRGDAYVWSSRYHCILAPIGLATYLLLVRFAAPAALTGLLAVAMLVSYGWNWQGYLANTPTYAPAVRKTLAKELRDGKLPLSLVAEAHGPQVGWSPGWGNQNLVGWWMDLRAHRLSEFRKMPPNVQPYAALAVAGELDGNLQPAANGHAVRGAGVRLRPGAAEGRAAFRFHVPVGGFHMVWVRCSTESAGPHRVTVRLDGGSPQALDLGYTEGFKPYHVGHGALQAGEHTLDVGLHDPRMIVDVVEVVRQP